MLTRKARVPPAHLACPVGWLFREEAKMQRFGPFRVRGERTQRVLALKIAVPKNST